MGGGGLAHIRPYGFDLDRLDGLGEGVGGENGNIPWTCIHPPNTGWVGWVCGMVTYLGGGMVTYLWTCTHPANTGWMGWVGGVGWGG